MTNLSRIGHGGDFYEAIVGYASIDMQPCTSDIGLEKVVWFRAVVPSDETYWLGMPLSMVTR